MFDILTSLLPVIIPGAGGMIAAGLIAYKKIRFYYQAAKQAVELFNEVKEANQEIFDRIKNNPERKELAKVLSGGIKKIEGLAGVK